MVDEAANGSDRVDQPGGNVVSGLARKMVMKRKKQKKKKKERKKKKKPHQILGKHDVVSDCDAESWPNGRMVGGQAVLHLSHSLLSSCH